MSAIGITKNIEEKLKKFMVKDIMTRSVIVATETENLSDLADMLIKSRISGLPVLNKKGDLAGIVTITDLLLVMDEIRTNGLMKFKGKNPSVASIMSKIIFTLNGDETLLDVVDIMCKKNIHTLPVVMNGKLIGVIGRRDVIMYFYAAVRDCITEEKIK